VYMKRLFTIVDHGTLYSQSALAIVNYAPSSYHPYLPQHLLSDLCTANPRTARRGSR
jgi:hypothetical protein